MEVNKVGVKKQRQKEDGETKYWSLAAMAKRSLETQESIRGVFAGKCPIDPNIMNHITETCII